jgi:hypothetical protein
MRLRLTKGTCMICWLFKVLATFADCDCTISVFACTVMVSLLPPTSSMTLIDAGAPATSLMSFTIACLKPVIETVAV